MIQFYLFGIKWTAIDVIPINRLSKYKKKNDDINNFFLFINIEKLKKTHLIKWLFYFAFNSRTGHIYNWYKCYFWCSCWLSLTIYLSFCFFASHLRTSIINYKLQRIRKTKFSSSCFFFLFDFNVYLPFI